MFIKFKCGLIIQNSNVMGQSESQTKIQQQYDIVKLRDDGCALLHHKVSQDQFLLRTVSSGVGQEITGFEQILKKRKQVKSPHLLQLVQIHKKEEKNICSVAHKMYLLIEYPFKTLRDQISDKVSETKIIPFLEAELWSILYSCCLALKLLYQNKMPHQSLTLEQIFIDRDGLIKISDPILFGLEKNYIKALKNNGEHVQISPQIINFLDDCNFSFYDKQKSDIFILGAVMLEASLLRQIQLFDPESKKPFLFMIPQLISELRKKYSMPYCQVIEKMLQIHSKLRPKFIDLIIDIEKDNNLNQSTEENSTKNFSNTAQSYGKNLNEKANTKTLKGWNQQIQARTQPISLRNSHRQENLNSLNFQKKFEEQTIIKQLQKETMVYSEVKNYPENPLQLKQFHPNFGKPNIQYVNSSYAGGQKVVSKKVGQHQAFSQGAINMKDRGQIEQQNERFSLVKFGNVNIREQKKNEPLYSYQIPEINQILQSRYSKNSSGIRINQSPISNFQSSNSSMQSDFLRTHSKSTQKEKKSILVNENGYQSPNIKKFDFCPRIPQKYSLNQVPLVSSTFKQFGQKKRSIYTVTQKSEENLQVSKPIPNPQIDLKIKEPQKSPGPSEISRSSAKKQRSPCFIQNSSSKTDNGRAQYKVILLQGGGKYSGYLINGFKYGHGKLEFNDGGFYQGEWKDNKMNGYGKLHFENGQVAYQGNWENDEFCGIGRVFNDRPEKFFGSFNYHDFAGLGQKWFYYEGNFKNDSKHGRGKIRLTNGEVFEGSFVFDSVQGEGVFYTIHGEAIKGKWEDNILRI